VRAAPPQTHGLPERSPARTDAPSHRCHGGPPDRHAVGRSLHSGLCTRGGVCYTLRSVRAEASFLGRKGAPGAREPLCSAAGAPQVRGRAFSWTAEWLRGRVRRSGVRRLAAQSLPHSPSLLPTYSVVQVFF